MIRKANKTMIGAFVVGAVVLLMIAIAMFSSGQLFRLSDKYVLFFDGSVKGLSEGAPVIFKGVKIGSVSDISLIYDPGIKKALIEVIIDVELERIKGMPDVVGYPNYDDLVKQGLEAKLEVQSFVTGQLMIEFDFYSNSTPKLYGLVKEYPELPTRPISPDIFKIMEDVPIKDISNNLVETVEGLNRLLNSEGIMQLGPALQELTGAARSVRLFTEYLEQHPEAFLKGKSIPKGE